MGMENGKQIFTPFANLAHGMNLARGVQLEPQLWHSGGVFDRITGYGQTSFCTDESANLQFRQGLGVVEYLVDQSARQGYGYGWHGWILNSDMVETNFRCYARGRETLEAKGCRPKSIMAQLPDLGLSVHR